MCPGRLSTKMYSKIDLLFSCLSANSKLQEFSFFPYTTVLIANVR